ncbi:ABC-F family ATP-binding cassette domain-containing protein [Corynebacterium urogenitale]
MSSINLNDVAFSYTNKPLLDHITLSVQDGERACLVGPNGCGKSTLLRIIAGQIVPDEGDVSISDDGELGTSLSQFLGLGSSGLPQTVAGFLGTALAQSVETIARFEAVTEELVERPNDEWLSSEYDSLLAEMTARELWSLDARIDYTLSGLGLENLSGDGRQRSLSTLSPGQVVRLRLAATLVAQPTVLILDEPTSHLDPEAVDFLAEFLLEREGPLMFVSHDRAFIEKVATCIYDLDVSAWQAVATAEGSTNSFFGVYRCAGAYSHYLETKIQARSSHEKLHQEQQESKRSLRSHRHQSLSIARGGSNLAGAEGKAKKFFADRAASTSVRRTRSDDRRLDKLEALEVRKPRFNSFRLVLEPPSHAVGLAVSVRDASIPHRLDPVTFDIAYGEKLLITGGNGAGKSTLLDWIATGEPPTSVSSSAGFVDRGRGTVLVPQRLPQLGDPGFPDSVWESGIGDSAAGALHPSLWHTPVSKLSAGNQRRAQFAVAVARRPDILLIDEPTNYLDLDTVESLERALSAWKGTLIVTSHDRWLIDKWQDSRIHLRKAL